MRRMMGKHKNSLSFGLRIITLRSMNRFLWLLFFICTATLRAEELPSAQQMIAFARAQLPKQPIRMKGSLKERASNGFVKKELTVEMDLNWGANPATAAYRIRDPKSGRFHCLDIEWASGGTKFRYSENGANIPEFDPNQEISGLGVTWDDLSFSFLWSEQAETAQSDQKLGRDCYVISVPRRDNLLLLWIEQDTGRVLGAKEETADGRAVKEIKVVSVKEFDGLWMVKDLDIVRPLENRRATLRIDDVEAVGEFTQTAPAQSPLNQSVEK